MKILIVEENPSLRSMIKSILDLGHADVSEATDASSALRAYSTYHPDWVLIDLTLKETSGLDATRLLKRMHPEAHVMIMTDRDSLTLREKVREAGGGGVLVKEKLFEDLQRTKFLPTDPKRYGGT